MRQETDRFSSEKSESEKLETGKAGEGKMKKIAVVGSINMDMTVTAERIPLKGETLRGDSIRLIPGGKGANQAAAMAKLGAQTEMFGCVGDDSNGSMLLQNLQKAGVKTEHIKICKDTPTGIAMITVAENDNTIVVVPGANGRADKAYIDEIKPYLMEYDMVVLQHEIPLETVAYVVDFCAENGIQAVLNPAPAAEVPMDVIEKVTYLTPNEHEAALIFGEGKPAEELLRQYPEKLIITQGSKGVCACLESGEILHVPARPAKVADTTGAGDTLNGAFCVRRAAGDDLKSALLYANTAASLSTEKFGAQAGMPSAKEVEEELSKGRIER